MKTLTVLVLAGAAIGAQASPVIFYGGDFDGVDGLASQVNGPGFTSQVYDNFSLATSMNIDNVFGNFLDSGSQRGATLTWEIRTGVSTGNGGSLVASGDTAASAVATGNVGFGLTEYKYSADISPVLLSAGDYFLSVAVNGGDGNIYVSTTDGTNGVGGPLNDDNSYINSSTFGLNFEATDTIVASPDFSIGLGGSSPVPEPASFAVLGLGAIALIRRRKA